MVATQETQYSQPFPESDDDSDTSSVPLRALLPDEDVEFPPETEDTIEDFEADLQRGPTAQLEDAYGDEDNDLSDIDETYNYTLADDPVSVYFRQMGQEPLLNAKEEVSLAKRIEAGLNAKAAIKNTPAEADRRSELEATIEDSEDARKHLGSSNTRLVVSIAKRYIGNGLPFPDLIGEGNIGLMKAIDKYNYKLGNRFSTYATWWIRQSITRALSNTGRAIRIPVHMNDASRKHSAQIRDWEEQEGPLSQEEILTRTGLSKTQLDNLNNVPQQPKSLEEPIGQEGTEELQDAVADTENSGPVEQTNAVLLREGLTALLQNRDLVSERNANILMMRYGLTDGEDHTLEEVGNAFGVTRERIRQLEAKALRALRSSSHARSLRDFLNED